MSWNLWFSTIFMVFPKFCYNIMVLTSSGKGWNTSELQHGLHIAVFRGQHEIVQQTKEFYCFVEICIVQITGSYCKAPRSAWSNLRWVTCKHQKETNWTYEERRWGMRNEGIYLNNKTQENSACNKYKINFSF